jgi:predicted oxidoreductase
MRISGTMARARWTAEREAAGRAAILTAYEAGSTHFDHADIHGNGMCEEIFSRVLKHVPDMRDRVLIGAKCGIRWKGEPDASAPHCWDLSREHILRSCEGSLKRLGIDHIDLYMQHRPDYLADPQEIAAAFRDLKRQGSDPQFGETPSRGSIEASGRVPWGGWIRRRRRGVASRPLERERIAGYHGASR